MVTYGGLIKALPQNNCLLQLKGVESSKIGRKHLSWACKTNKLILKDIKNLNSAEENCRVRL